MKSKSIFPKSLLILIKVSCILLVVGFVISCSKEPYFKESLIKVDSVTIESIPTEAETELYAVDLHGTISSSGCSYLSFVKTYTQNSEFFIEAWKMTEVGANICPTVMVYLDYRMILDKYNLPENCTLKIKQPDGSFLEKTLP